MERQEDLRKGKQAELEFMDLLSQSEKVATIEWPQGNFPDYDIKTKLHGGMEYTYEVKRDGIYPTSRQVGIEFERKGCPSGILTSKADFYVYKLGEDFYFAKKGRLLELLMLSTTKRFCQGGDDGTVKLWVIPEEEFYKVATKYERKS